MSATKTFGEWLQERSVHENKMYHRNNLYNVGRNNADTADLNMFRIDTDDNIEAGTLLVYKGLLDAMTPNTALVTKEYVLNVLAGLRDPKDAVRVASIGNLDLASVPASIDGAAMNQGDRFLAKNQTDPIENGIYVYPAAAGNAAVRSEDADEDAEVTQGLSCIVNEGNVNARRQYLLTTADPIVVDTTALTFVRIPNPADLVIQENETLSLDATDLDTNGYKDLSVQALGPSIRFFPKGGPLQENGVDYTISLPASVTRLTFGLSGTSGSLGEKLKEILDSYGSCDVMVYYERLAD
jgi:hypothetical protein